MPFDYYYTDGVNIYREGGCEYYGVKETGQPLGVVVKATAVFWRDLDELCPMAEAVRGCAIAWGDGTVTLYWEQGDFNAEKHEWCHALHGFEHT